MRNITVDLTGYYRQPGATSRLLIKDRLRLESGESLRKILLDGSELILIYREREDDDSK